MLKKHFKEELTLDEWQLVKDLKTFFAIMWIDKFNNKIIIL